MIAEAGTYCRHFGDICRNPKRLIGWRAVLASFLGHSANSPARYARSMKNTASQFLSPTQIRHLSQTSNWSGVRGVGHQWLWIIASFTLVTLIPNPITVIFAVVVIGTRQLGLAIAQHDGAHRSLARSAWLNTWLGQWLSAAPVAQDMERYRIHHLRHHGHTGTERDPDQRLADGFPITKPSMRRKFLRDISGLTGLKTLIGSLLMLAGLYRYDVSGGPLEKATRHATLGQRLVIAIRGLAPFIVMNTIIWLALAVFASGWLYLLWVAGLLFVYPWVLRVRSMAEHALTLDYDDALNNSRTTYGKFWEKALYAPLNVNYHLEHHMLSNVPYNRMPEMHQMLIEAGAFEHSHCVEQTYGDVMAKVTAKHAA
jgi:fatty acid desaturase